MVARNLEQELSVQEAAPSGHEESCRLIIDESDMNEEERLKGGEGWTTVTGPVAGHDPGS